jgi:hypothetical protein
MRILTLSAAIIQILCLAAMVSCKYRGSLTPEDAFNDLKTAYAKSDAGTVTAMLSSKSLVRIQNIIKSFREMSDEQLQSLSGVLGVEAGKLRNITIKEYIAVQMAAGKKSGGDSVRELLNYKIVGSNINGNTATVRAENGMELSFEKDGPYWKYEME